MFENVEARSQFIYLKRVVFPEFCEWVVTDVVKDDWRPGTYSNGKHRPNVSVHFSNHPELVKFVESVGVCAAGLMGVDAQADVMKNVQISRWGAGDSYGWHVDHDPQLNPQYDRKVSVFMPLRNTGVLSVDKQGDIEVPVGDALIINSIMSHAAPEQVSGERISMVGWVMGKKWS